MQSNGEDQRRMPSLLPRDCLTQLNDLLSFASRRLFQSQLVLRAASEREIRAELPDLCAFATSLCLAASQSPAHGAVILQACSDPSAQWLSRSAVESGASGFFCHLLLRETVAMQAEQASRVVIQLLLDPVVNTCNERLGETNHACVWRGEKPKYYAMTCANLWETLLPFLARAARQHPTVFGAVMNQLIQTTRGNPRTSVNCRFAQVAGFWRLLEAVSDNKLIVASPRVCELRPQILAFVVRWSILCPDEQDEASEAMNDPCASYYDLLMNKFFHDLQEFLFKCAQATSLTRLALKSVLELHLSTRSIVSSITHIRLTAFAVTACLLVKGLSEDVQEIIRNQRSVMLSSPRDTKFLLVVGLLGHLEPMDVKTVLCGLHELLDRYDQVSHSPVKRRRILLWVMYIIVCRQHFLGANRMRDSVHFVRLQQRICSMDMEDLQLMPLHWMEIVWKVCLGMHNDDVATFSEEARASRVALFKLDNGVTPLAWETMIHQMPSRHLDQYPSIMAILGSPYLESLNLTKHSSVHLSEDVTEKLVHQSIKKRRRLRRDAIVLSEEHEQSRQNALLLPEVMERIASFMSAKRLCRVSLVCRSFARIMHSERLWKPLYLKLVQPLKIKCRHGVAYEHDWRLMYQAKYIAIKKMRNRQLAAARKAQRGEDMAFCWHGDNQELRMSVTVSSARLCQECGCSQLLTTNEAAKNHRVLHQKYRCPQAHCRDSLTSASAFKQHMRHSHNVNASKETSRGETQECDIATSSFKCTVSGCSRSYKSLKWLQTHQARVHSEEALES